MTNACKHLCRLAVTLLLPVVLSCSDGLTQPEPGKTTPPSAVPGWLLVVLTTPHHDDGVVQLTLSGGLIDSLQLTGRGFASIVDGARKLLIAGDVESGIVARILVPDIRAVAHYQGSVEAAAARATYELHDVTQGYSVRVTR